MSQTSPPPIVVSQEGIQIEFYWTGDRFAHTILGTHDTHGGQPVPLLESIEGSPEDHFPASPPLVDLHQQDETIFLTGATTAGHWSMSIESEESGFLFDTACRVKSLPGSFTSSYRFAKSVQASQCDSSLILSTASGSFRLESLPLPDAQKSLSCQLAVAGNEVLLKSHAQEGSALPMTVRWRYRLIAI
ncbi:MAG: hypothetical protein GXP28_05425 [Planctomycetes bacterium]|nr:hypothetical protein [Planctomycetota bacterium]